MQRHEILGGKIQLYRRADGGKWRCSASVGGKQRRSTTKEDSLSLAKQIAEDWYLGQAHDTGAVPPTCSIPSVMAMCYSPDRAYDSDALRLELAARGAWANIKPMPNRIRRPAFSAFLASRAWLSPLRTRQFTIDNHE